VSDSIPPAWELRYSAPTLGMPTWSRHAPDRLVYVGTESGSYQVHAWDRTTGIRRQVSDNPIGVVDGFPTADGSGVIWFQDQSGDEAGIWVVAAFDGGAPEPLVPDLDHGWQAGLASGLEVVVGVRSSHDGYALWSSVRGAPAKELASGTEPMMIAGLESIRSGFPLAGLSADESLVCVETADRGSVVHRALRVVDPRTGEIRGEQWDGEGRGLEAGAWSPIPGDARLLLDQELGDLQRPAIWNVANGEREDLEVDLPGEVFTLDWWPDARSILVAHLFEGRDELFRLDLDTRALERIPHPEGILGDARVRPDGEVWMGLSAGEWQTRILSSGETEVLRAEGEPAPAGLPLRSWHFSNPSGDRVHGFYVTPAGTGPFPVVMLVHGGPTGQDGDEWNPDAQAFVDHGFAVGMVNYRGSTGYGRAWRDFLVGNIGFPEEEDVLAGLDDLVAKGIADPDRAVIAGWSWGGYLALLCAGRDPERWKAVVGGVPVGDYVACYEDLSPDLQAYDRYLLGGKAAHDVPELMAERSPIVYVDKVRAPVLCLIGENDTRCPPRQAHIWVDAVRSHGGKVEVYSYETGHSSFVVDEEIRHMRAVFDFLARHVPTG
jgi:dipeptidyl aminopeptidase/acylaminoacyl peptidase